MRISDWSSDVCSSDLHPAGTLRPRRACRGGGAVRTVAGPYQSSATIAPPLPPTPVVTLGLVPRAHSAVAPNLSREVGSELRAWIAGTRCYGGGRPRRRVSFRGCPKP